MRVLLLSTYELGHQPLHLASPAAALRAAGHDVRCLDLSVDPFEEALADWADVVGISVPMHTAMRLGVVAAGRLRRRRPDLPICFYGLYAAVSRDRTVGVLADRVIAGEYEPALLEWVEAASAGENVGRNSEPTVVPTGGWKAEPSVRVELGKSRFELPARQLLPPLDRYAHLQLGGEHRLVGYLEASHGCRHRCKHCPIPAVYDGRYRVVDEQLVLADAEQLTRMGARHLTLGDADFLNGPAHSLRVLRSLHASFPELTFDITAKVEHLLDHAELWPELAGLGVLFVVSAFETTNDYILRLLDKGHTAAGAAQAVALLRRSGIEVRPSWLPFTPWTALDDLADIASFVAEHDLISNLDPVQLSIRLLIPEGSLVLDLPEVVPYLEEYDADALTWRWHCADPAVDRLQSELAEIAEESVGGEAVDALASMFETIGLATGRRLPLPSGSTVGRPKLTEPWFC